MRADDFDQAMPGRLIKSVQGHWTFVPNPLPPKIELSWRLVARLSEAERAVSELVGVARNLPSLDLLIAPFARREAVLSSRIEGTQTSLSELILFEVSGRPKHPNSDVREVANYVQALYHGLDWLRKAPISLRLIRELHERLMRGVRGQERAPGEFRKNQNWIGPPGCHIDDATYVPPSGQHVVDGLDALEKYINASSDIPALVRVALIHYQFEAIHPFMDGNGRIGRLLITLYLCKEGLLPRPLLYLSPFLEANRDDYYRLLLSVSQSGAWAEWIAFFLRGVRDQARDVMARSDRLIRLRDTYRGNVQALGGPATALRLVDDLFEFPAISVAKKAAQYGMSQAGLQRNVDKLVRAGMLTEATGRSRGRVYVAPGVLEIVGS